ncbi:MAG: lysophospholipid acyltransferase family protein [Flavobacteriales bacterium]|nr:lysophospholipid acyltransferase family protein [Flavobacteriales bacterium]
MESSTRAGTERLVSRADLALWSGLNERHPLVGLFHRFGGIRRLNLAYDRLAHLGPSDFIQQVFSQLGVRIALAPEDLHRIPKEGGFILVSNHPFGPLDALALVSEISKVRPDFRLGVEDAMGRIPQLEEAFVVVSDAASEGGGARISGWREAAVHLAEGGGFGVFPALEVSSYRRSKKWVADGRWNAPLIGWASKQGVPIVPVYIDGANSPLSQWLGLIHPSLRSLRMPAEIQNKKGQVLRMRVGHPIKKRDLTGFESHDQLARFLRAKSYAMGAAYEVQRDLFKGLRFPKRPVPVAAAIDTKLLCQEMEELADAKLFSHQEFDVFYASAERIPQTLKEIGRCREMTFRAVGEGTNKALDLDEYDLYYQHLLLWDREANALAGAYRVGEGWEIMERYGARGFYTRSLFRMRKGFHPVLRSSVELGRSFIVPDYQRKRMPLFLLWKGILAVLLKSNEARYVLGPVTISSDYKQFSRSLIMGFVRRHFWEEKWAAFIRPRKRFAFEENRADADALLEGTGGDVKRLDRILADIERPDVVVPVLLKKYLHQNARILGFNRDPKFNDALDGLMLLDVRDLPAETLENLQREFGFS